MSARPSSPWGDADNTRKQVLIAESRIAPTVDAGCKVTAGGVVLLLRRAHPDRAGRPGHRPHGPSLAEAGDFGASQWTPARREAYSNDPEAERSLIAVTAKTNRSN